MHELTIAREIIRVLSDSLSPEKLSRLKRINLLIGRTATVQEDCLRLGLEAVSKGTPFSGAVVNIEYVEPLFKCKSCARKYSTDNWFFAPCPGCGSYGCELVKGDELSVASVELE